MSLALAAEELVISVGTDDPAPSAERLLGFSRAMEWLAREAEAGVVAALPRELAGHRELDGIAFGAAHWTAAETAVPAIPVESEKRKQQEKLAGDMADNLKTEQATNPLLRTSGTPLDPAVLFGDDRPGGSKTRISVISLVGLKTDAAQQYFLNQLAMRKQSIRLRQLASLQSLIVAFGNSARSDVPAGWSQ